MNRRQACEICSDNHLTTDCGNRLSAFVIGGLNVYAGSLPLVTTQPLLGLRGGDIVEICQHALSRELNYVQIGLLAGWVAYNDILCERCGAVGHARRQNICTKFRHLLRLNAPPVDDNLFQANIEFIDVLRASDILALLRPALAEALMAWSDTDRVRRI